MAGGVRGRTWIGDAERGRILSLARGGKTAVEIAAIEHRHPESVRNICKQAGFTLASPPSRWSQKEVDLIATMALDGHGIGSISKALGRPRDNTGRIARKFGIRVVPPRTPHRVRGFFLSERLWIRLEALATECHMRPAAAARLIVMACLRDPWLLGNVLQPSAFVEGEPE
jgi:hypothetical protein